MAFRKWLLAFAVVAILSSVASAQITGAVQCVANAGVPPTVRYEGLTELVGDLVLNCNGGTPTLAINQVPMVNVTIFLSTNITSRLYTTAAGYQGIEATLLIDEPHSISSITAGKPAGTPLLLCDAQGINGTPCSIPGSATNNGLNTYDGTTAPNRYNAFTARQTGVNQVTFFGIPFDPPGTQTTRILRITNIRGNANQAGTSSTLVPQPITAYISISGSTSIAINNPSQVVAYVQPGLSMSRSTNTFVQCNSTYGSWASNGAAGDKIVGDIVGLGNTLNPVVTSNVGVKFSENFGTAWKVRNISEVLNYGVAAQWQQGADYNQNVPGAIYNTETGFFNASLTDPNPNPPGWGGAVLTTTNDGTWKNAVGSATQGTRLMVTFANVPNGVTIFVPISVNTQNSLTNKASGLAELVTTDANGAGAFSLASGSANAAPVSITNGSGIAVWEIVGTDPYATEYLNIPMVVAYVANVAANLPEPGKTATALGSFAPLSNVTTASTSAPIPRFVPSLTPLSLFSVVKCSCNMLFPFVTNQQGYDTGIAISNTSLDTINGVAPQSGTVTLAYFGGSTPPPNQTTNAVVPGGGQVLFTLSGGGNYGIAATPGFQGYIVAQAQFQYCHAFAYISAQGALPTAPGASESYLGLILDYPYLQRTGQGGEVLGH